MKLVLNTLGCPAWPYAKIVEQAAVLGYQGIEIRGILGEKRAECIPEFQPGRQLDTLRGLREKNLTIVGFGTSAMFHDPDKVEASVTECRAAIDVCRAMDIGFIRVFGDAIPDPARERETIDQIIAGYKRVVAYAQGSGVRILMEVHGDFNRVERLQAVLEGVDDPSLGILWDVEHSDKVYGDDYRAFYLPLKRYIHHVHIKDYLRDGKYTLCEIGKGDIPLRGIVRMLLEDRYDGYFAIEWEKMWHPELPEPEVVFPEYVTFMRAIERG